MQMPAEGVIKYTSHHTRTSTLLEALWMHEQKDPLILQHLEQLDNARTALHKTGLIGVNAEGIGYGNVSLRTTPYFIISGSNTGNFCQLGPNRYSLVTSADPRQNSVRSWGPVRASSEAMTHAALYLAHPEITCVIHIHSETLFQRYRTEAVLQTSPESGYGTPELSFEIKKCVQRWGAPTGFLLTLGHEPGLFIFSSSIATALQTTLGLL